MNPFDAIILVLLIVAGVTVFTYLFTAYAFFTSPRLDSTLYKLNNTNALSDYVSSVEVPDGHGGMDRCIIYYGPATNAIDCSFGVPE